MLRRTLMMLVMLVMVVLVKAVLVVPAISATWQMKQRDMHKKLNDELVDLVIKILLFIF